VREAIPGHEAVLVSDYAKGVCTSRLLSDVIEAATAHDIPVLVDPARGVDYRRYHGASILAPNRQEAATAAGVAVETLEGANDAGQYLCRICDSEAAVVKLDGDGMGLIRPGRQPFAVPARARAVRDVTGAGDVVLAVLGICRAAGISLEEAVELANAAAAVEVGKAGAATVTWREIYDAIGDSALRAADKDRAARRSGRPRRVLPRRGQKHRAVQRLLRSLARWAHRPLAGSGAARGRAGGGDQQRRFVQRLKGPGRPVIRQEDRAAMLAALACVDHVTVFGEDTPHEVLRRLRPDVLAKGGTTEEVVGRDVVESYGGQIRVIGHIPHVSTTQILGAVRNRKPVRPVRDAGHMWTTPPWIRCSNRSVNPKEAHHAGIK
jgi:D-beta-D-heptose 7-phosphate kinase / D-beta-D-heptose 1-phosphate adenosyltransferase